MGPLDVQEHGPVKFEKLSIKIVPEDSSRLAAMLAGQFDVTHQFPLQFLQQVQGGADADGAGGQARLPAGILRFQDHAAHGVRPARAPGDEHRHQPRRDRQGHNSAATPIPAYTFVDPQAPDFATATKGVVKEDVELAKKLLDEAGWKPGADGIREKDGMKLAPKVYFTAGRQFRPHVSEAIQGYLRKIGIDWQLQPYNSTIAAGEDGRAGLRDLDGGSALPVGRRPDEYLFRFQEHPDAQPDELAGRRKPTSG